MGKWEHIEESLERHEKQALKRERAKKAKVKRRRLLRKEERRRACDRHTSLEGRG